MKRQSLPELIEIIMSDGAEYTPYDVREALIKEFNRYHSDGTVSRSMRHLRERGWDMHWRYKGEGSATTLYRIERAKPAGYQEALL